MTSDCAPESHAVRTLAELGIAERLFVWGFRSAAQRQRLGWPSMDEMRRVYGHFGVADAVPSLDAMLDTFACTAHRTVELHSPGCPCISVSEYGLLQATATAQRGDTDLARRRFEHWLPELAADWILGPSRGLGRIFALRGLTLPVRSGTAPAVGETMLTRSWPIGSTALH